MPSRESVTLSQSTLTTSIVYSTISSPLPADKPSSQPQPSLNLRLPAYTPAQSFANSHLSPFSQHNGDVMVGFGGNVGSTGKGILIGILSAFGSAGVAIIVLAVFFFFRYTQRGRIILDRIGRPGEYDDEQAFAREEAEALETMDELQQAEYLRAKAFIQANPPETMQTDISLSQFLAIQEKGVSAWEFEPELEIANCFVEARTEIEFFDSECSVQSNLPVPKQNEVYYWEAKIYDKPETSLISIGMTTKPYPLFRLPGFHKTSVAYLSTGHRRYNQPFTPASYGPEYVQGDVIGVGYRPRTGAIFFTRNGKKLDDAAHGLKSQNFFPTVGANGPCTVHVNFGQMGFVFIEANVKKWGLAPMTGSLAPPPPYGSEQGSILLETGREGHQPTQWWQHESGHSRTRSGTIRMPYPTSPGPVRSPTDISLAQLSHVSTQSDVGEGSSGAPNVANEHGDRTTLRPTDGISAVPPPEYSSPRHSPPHSEHGERSPPPRNSRSPPIPTYDAAVRNDRGRQQSH
ncbi:protein SSH4 [[Emmonsia] crescens]|uniref:Protein SSH4 n=1 Tax=[Emmonsia] crescens TaxID=73230 RepID=A0A2B7ZBM7_9EURO|nr:protein SSH4 [Emmonsia crescens]